MQLIENRVQFVANVDRGNPQDLYALFRQPAVTVTITRLHVGVIVNQAIHLNREPRRWAIEVENIGSDRMLAANRRAEVAAADMTHNRASGGVIARRIALA